MELGLGPLHLDAIGGFAEVHDERAVRPVLVTQPLDLAVVDQRAVIDEDDPATQAFDVGEIVGREDEGRSAFAVHARR